MNPVKEVELWTRQSNALTAVMELSRIQRYRVLSYLAETAPDEVLAAIEKAGQ